MLIVASLAVVCNMIPNYSLFVNCICLTLRNIVSMHMALNSHSLNSHNILFCLRSSKSNYHLTFNYMINTLLLIISYMYNYNKYELLLV